MKRNTFAIKFYCKEAKKSKIDGLSPLEVSISVNTERKFITLPYRYSPALFPKRKKKDDVSVFVDSTTIRIYSYIAELQQKGYDITATNIAEAIRNNGVKDNIYTIEQLFDDYEDILKKRIGVDMDAAHFRKYTLVRDKFFTIVDKDKPAANISNADILSFKTLITKELSESTRSGYFSRLKGYITFGINNGKITRNPMEGIRVKRVEKEVITIEDEDVEKLINTDFHGNERLKKIRDMFLVSAGSGLAFADVCRLRKEDFKYEDDRLVIIKDRKKTDVKFYSVLLPFAEDIVKRYDFDLSSIMASNQKCNAYLKEIQVLCGIESVDSLHFHLARHYYATHAINSGIPLEIVSKMVGHTNVKQTLHYAKLLKKTIISTASRKLD